MNIDATMLNLISRSNSLPKMPNIYCHIFCLHDTLLNTVCIYINETNVPYMGNINQGILLLLGMESGLQIEDLDVLEECGPSTGVMACKPHEVESL